MNDSDRRRSPDGFDDDAIFADIIAHLKAEESASEQPARPIAGEAPTYQWPTRPIPDEAVNPPPGDAADVDAADADATDADPADETTAPPQQEPEVEPQAVPAAQGWRAHEVDDADDDEHFEPQPVTPLPVGDLQFWAILAGMIGGPLLLVYLVFFNRNMSSYWTLTAIAMSVGGFVLLVSRLPGNEGDDDDGARL